MKDFGRHLGFGPVQGGVGVGAPLDGQRVSIQPATFTPGTILGRSAKITYAPTSDQIAQGIKQSETVALWQGRPYESQAMTVDIGTVVSPPALGIQGGSQIIDARPFATIQYGSDGSIQNEVVADLGRGQRFTVVASYISVSVGMDPPRPAIASEVAIYGQPVSPVLIVNGTIGTFAAGSPQAPVIRTVYIDQLAAGAGTPLIPIPTRAVALLPPVPGVFTDKIEIEWYSLGGTSLGQWEAQYANTNPSWAPVPVPADAFFFVLVSTLGAPTAANQTNGIRVPFQLSL